MAGKTDGMRLAVKRPLVAVLTVISTRKPGDFGIQKILKGIFPGIFPFFPQLRGLGLGNMMFGDFIFSIQERFSGERCTRMKPVQRKGVLYGYKNAY
jgi:hypothetical protein